MIKNTQVKTKRAGIDIFVFRILFFNDFKGDKHRIIIRGKK